MKTQNFWQWQFHCKSKQMKVLKWLAVKIRNTVQVRSVSPFARQSTRASSYIRISTFELRAWLDSRRYSRDAWRFGDDDVLYVVVCCSVHSFIYVNNKQSSNWWERFVYRWIFRFKNREHFLRSLRELKDNKRTPVCVFEYLINPDYFLHFFFFQQLSIIGVGGWLWSKRVAIA